MNPPPTLLEDWQRRRERFKAAGKALLHAHPQDQVRVLDYLLERYGSDPAASVPAQFPMARDLFLDRRALLVHHHLGRDKGDGIKSAGEAGDRVGKILKRMKTQDAQSSIGAPADGAWMGKDDAILQAPDLSKTEFPFATYIEWVMGFRGNEEDRLISKLNTFDGLTEPAKCALMRMAFDALRHQTPIHWKGEVGHLPGRGGIGRPRSTRWDALEFLSACKHAGAFAFLHVAWRERLAAMGMDDLTTGCERGFRRPHHRPLALEKMRAEMTHASSLVRVRAAELLAEFGTLNDIGLLSDLLSLPPSPNEDAFERPGMLAAMKRLAKK